MRLLLISTWFPYPPDSGSRIRVNHLLKALAEKHEIRLITFVPDGRATAFLATLRSWGVETEAVRRDPFRRNPSRALLGYLSLKPRDVVSRFSAEMASLVGNALGRDHYDLVIASVAEVAPYVLLSHGVPRLLEEHNFMTAWMREEFGAQQTPARKLARWVTWQKCRRYERWLYPQFDAVTMVSERDRRALEATAPDMAGRVTVIPNGVDIGRNLPGIAAPQGDTLVFNGALTYHANADAMRFFLAEIMPAIHAQRPGVRLQITGRYNGVDLAGLRGDGDITLTGFLDDVRPVVAASWACVIPLRIGGGTRLKILEAMALGTPVISTSKGAEGLDVTPERELLIADDAAGFARQTVRLLGDPALRERLAANGRALVETKYDWDRIGQAFCRVVEAAASASRGPR